MMVARLSLLLPLLLLQCPLLRASAPIPSITRCSNCSNVINATDDLNVVKLLGHRGSAQECELACIAYNNTIPGARAWDSGPTGPYPGMHPGQIPSPLSGWARCNSYTWLAEDRRCFARVDDLWAPVDTGRPNTRGHPVAASSGHLEWPPATCATDADCSFNGRCGTSDNLCHCSAAWKGDKCQLLNLTPAKPSAGVQWRGDDAGGSSSSSSSSSNNNISTWGGSVLLVNGTYHMWLSEMVHHCGIDSCSRNSRVVHAVSASGEADGPYERREVVQGVASHEPTVVRAPGGELVMYYLQFHWGEPEASRCRCVNGSTLPDSCPPVPVGGSYNNNNNNNNNNSTYGTYNSSGKAFSSGGSDLRSKHQHQHQQRPGGGTYMSWARDPAGPWSDPQLIFQPGQWGEPHPDGTNLAVTILPNRSLVGMIKSSGGPQGSTIRLVTADDWRRPATYAARFDGGNLAHDLLFPLSHRRNVTQFGLEDQFLYRDAAGVFHALFHQQIEYDDQRICGGHAWSEDGLSWTYGGTAYSNRVEFVDDGGGEGGGKGPARWSVAYRRRERPHLVFGDPAAPFRPTHLVNGVQYEPGWFAGPTKWLGDATFTLVQPIAGG